MKTIMKTLSLIIVLAVMAVSAQAQTVTTQTITSSATPAGGNCINVASASGFSASTQAQTYLAWFDGELMKVNTIVGTSICGTRGYLKTRQVAHATAVMVFFGPSGGTTGPFTAISPVPGSACTSTQQQHLPQINYTDGTFYNCQTTARGGVWTGFNYQKFAFDEPIINIVDSNYTAVLADKYINYNSITTGRTLTLPAITGITGKVYVITNGATGNGAITVSPSAAQTFGPSGATSATVTAVGGALRLISATNTSGGYYWLTW